MGFNSAFKGLNCSWVCLQDSYAGLLTVY